MSCANFDAFHLGRCRRKEICSHHSVWSKQTRYSSPAVKMADDLAELGHVDNGDADASSGLGFLPGNTEDAELDFASDLGLLPCDGDAEAGSDHDNSACDLVLRSESERSLCLCCCG